MSENDTDKSPTRRAMFIGLATVLVLPAQAWAQPTCPRGGFHHWIVTAVDKQTGRVIQKCAKCGITKIG